MEALKGNHDADAKTRHGYATNKGQTNDLLLGLLENLMTIIGEQTPPSWMKAKIPVDYRVQLQSDHN